MAQHAVRVDEYVHDWESYFGLYDHEVTGRRVSRTRVLDIIARRNVGLCGFRAGSLAPGEFVFVGVCSRRQGVAACFWGMGVDHHGRLDCAYWRFFRLSAPANRSFRKRQIVSAISLRLEQLPTRLTGHPFVDEEHLELLRLGVALPRKR